MPAMLNDVTNGAQYTRSTRTPSCSVAEHTQHVHTSQHVHCAYTARTAPTLYAHVQHLHARTHTRQRVNEWDNLMIS